MGRLGTVIVPEVVVDLLEVPAILAGVQVNGDYRGGEQIVTRPPGTVQVGASVAGEK